MNLNNITTNWSNVTSNVTTGDRDLNGRFIKQLIPQNGWFILAQFFKLKYSLSVNELYKIFHGGIHLNTIRSMILRLKEKSWIKLHMPKTGLTRRENRYIITLDGLAVYSAYNGC